jgi:hypothetical protein
MDQPVQQKKYYILVIIIGKTQQTSHKIVSASNDDVW